MRKHRLQSVIRPKNRRYSISKTVYTRNKLGRNFSASSPYDKLTTDIQNLKEV